MRIELWRLAKSELERVSEAIANEPIERCKVIKNINVNKSKFKKNNLQKKLQKHIFLQKKK